jgi:hypothetical protein
MNSNAHQYAEAIQNARSGNERAERFLRLRLKSTADAMPAQLLLSLSELILQYRRDEQKDEARRN